MRQVIYAWNYLEWGGAQIHFLALIKVVRKEFPITVALPYGSDAKLVTFLKDQDVPYRFFVGHADLSAARTLRRKIARRWAKIRSEYAMLKHLQGYDLADSIVHVDLLPHSSLLSLIWLCLNTTVFITSHNRMPPVSRWRERLWLAKARIISRFPNFHVFCSNEDTKAYFSAQYSPEKARSIEVTPTSVNPDEIKAAAKAKMDIRALREKHGLRNDAFVVLSVGNFIDRKGRWVFLEAAAKVLEGDPNVQFAWLTPSVPAAGELRRIEAFGLGTAFRLISSDEVGSDRMDILRFFRVADVFALASYVEGLPIALLEAMAMGIPSISTEVNAIPEALKNLETGLLISPGNADELADAILEYKANPDLRTELARKGREYVLRNFDEREAAKKVLRSYKKALGL